MTQPDVVVVCVVMEGCSACHEFLPRFRKIAAKYAHCIPAMVINASNSQQAPIADRFRVRVTPTTLILRRPVGQIRLEGAVSNAELGRAFMLAARALRCP